GVVAGGKVGLGGDRRVDDDRRAEIVEDGGTLLGGEPRIERRDNGAELERAQERRREGPAVRQRERHAITGRHGLVREGPRNTAGPSVERAIRQRAAAAANGGSVGVLPRRRVQSSGEGRCPRPPRGQGRNGFRARRASTA